MRIGLSMMVKDEANRITGALDDIIDLFDHVTITDTGSTDGTPDILRERYGIDVLRNDLEDWDCRCHGRVRNIGYDQNKSPWILTLDGDERVARDTLESIIAMPEPDDANLAGYFCAWNTHRDGGLVVDYKLPLLRGDCRREGLAHDNAQYAIRREGNYAAWLDGLNLEHFPEEAKDPDKRRFYRWQLECSLRQDAGRACRYHWFLGYMLFRQGDFAAGEQQLASAVATRDPLYPVERLNAAMVLADIHARHADGPSAVTVLAEAHAYFNTVADDFEVRVNFRLGPWLYNALEAARSGDLEAVRAYDFAC